MSEGTTRRPGEARLPANTATPFKGTGVVVAARAAMTAPAGSRSRSRIRVDTEPEHARAVRSALVGREDALATLRDAITRAVDFQAPQLVSIVGNQGTGKTRLVEELVARLREERPDVRVVQGVAERDTTSGKHVRLAALASLLRERFALAPVPDDADRKRFASEVRAVMGSEEVAELLYLIGTFVGLAFPPTPFLRAVSENAKQHGELARTALRRLFEVDAGSRPLVLVFDDLQWADDATLTIVSDLAAGLAGCPVVLVCAFRPEMLVRVAGWGEGASDATRIDLRNLEQPDAEAMLGNLLARCPDVPQDTVDAAVEMTGGNPAFLEQLVRLFIENGAIDVAGETWRLDPDRAADTELPVSIEDAIEARIAALETEERDLLEKAAVFGNVFWVSAVIALTRLERPSPAERPGALDIEWGPGEDVRRRVLDLVSILAERDYLLPLDRDDSSIPGDVEIVFKHNLERELIVRSTEPGKLERLYLAAAQWLESRLMALRDDQLEFLAGLYERGGDRRRAARCYLQGADRARARYSPEEARGLYEKGLAMLGESDAPALLDALHNLGDVLEQAGRAEDSAQRFCAMLELAWRYDNFNKAGAAYSRLARGHRRGGRYDLAMEHLQRAHQLFERSRDDRGIASTLDDIGRVHWLRGAYAQALDHHRQALMLRRAIGDRRSIALSLANLGRVHHDSGNFKAAIEHFREALELRRGISDLLGVVQSLCDLGGVHAEDGNHELALELLGEARARALEIGDKLALADVLSRTGEVRGAMGRGDEAAKVLDDAKLLAARLGDRVTLAVTHQRLASVHLARGDLGAAEVEAQAAVAVSQAAGLRAHVGSGLRVKAEVAAALGHELVAEDDFRKAIEILGSVRNEVELARAYKGLAALEERGGNLEQAHELRVRAVDIFTRLRGAAQPR